MTYLRKAIAVVIGLAALLSILILVLYSNPEFQLAVNLLIGSMIARGSGMKMTSEKPERNKESAVTGKPAKQLDFASIGNRVMRGAGVDLHCAFPYLRQTKRGE
jgi:Na+/H+-translocating membrane pyrophosphatase